MTQKQKSLIVLKILFGEKVTPDYIQKKIDEVFSLARPEVLLDLEGIRKYETLVAKMRREGKIY